MMNGLQSVQDDTTETTCYSLRLSPADHHTLRPRSRLGGHQTRIMEPHPAIRCDKGEYGFKVLVKEVFLHNIF